MGWDSPWGKGFPGWHIECTAMIFTLLGKQIDIHTGGIEHIPIHHNNEIAQAEAATGKQFAKYWLHHAHITVEGKKISKSLGNTVYLHNIVDKGYSPRAFRYWALTGHYRTPMNFTWEAVEGADQALKRLTRAYLSLSAAPAGSVDLAFKKDLYTALGTDLNTAQALARVWELVKDENVPAGSKKKSLELADKLLGLGFTGKQEVAKLAVIEEKELPEDIKQLLRAREDARAAKDFVKADELRKEIEKAGYTLKDTPQGAEVSKK
jgi:cysteinyl-tRNA synthetase